MAAITSNGTGGGNWTTGASWTGGIAPVLGDSVTIAAGDTITLDTTALAGGDDTATAIVVNGTLKASRTANCDLRVRGQITIKSGGTIDFGTSASPIPSTYTATLYLNDSAALAVLKWGIIAEDGANVYFYGAGKTLNTTLTNVGGIAVGATSMTIADGTGWAVGDRIVLQATDGTYSHDDDRTIATITLISGTAYTVTFTATTYAHAENARVGNFTHNVTIQSYNTSYYGYTSFVHNTVSTAGTREIQNTSFMHLNGASAGTYPLINGNSRSTLVWTAFKGISFYQFTSNGLMLYNIAGLITFEDFSIYNNSGTGISIAQGSFVNFTNGVIYRAGGSILYTAYSQGGQGVTFSNVHFGGCGVWMTMTPGIGFTFNDCTFHSALNYGFYMNAGSPTTFNRCSFASSDLPGTPYATILVYTITNSLCPVIMNDCKFKTSYSSAFASGISIANPNHYMIIANKDVDPSVQEIWKPTGNIIRDNTSKVSGVTSLKMSPLSATNALTFTMLIPAPTGKKVGVSGYLWRDTANVSTVTLSGLGITDSVYTASGSLSANEQFFVSGTQTTGTDGFLTLTISTIGTTGNMWVDGISAPQSAAIDFGEFGYWANGLPADIVTASYVSAGDVWNYLLTNITVAGSIGLQLKQYAKNVLKIG